MDISAAQQVMVRTHLAALKNEERASGLYLESGPGIGKSDGTFQACALLAKEINEPVGIVQEMLATYSAVDVRGFMMPVKGVNGGLDTIFSTPAWFPVKHNTYVVEPLGGGGAGAVRWHPTGTWDGPLPRVGVVFLDEFAQAEDEVKKSSAELVLKGRVGTCELPLGWRVVAAGNRTSDRSGVMRELMFIVNRRCRLAIDASLPAWLKWANALPDEKRPHYLTISFAQKNPDIVFREAVPDGTDPFCTPRTLCLMDRDLKALRGDSDIAHDRLPLDAVAGEVMAGWIGDAAAAQFKTHVKYIDALPDIEDVVKDPRGAKCPEGRDVQMVAAYMLAHHVNEKTAKPIMQYITRLNIEMQALAIRAVTQGKDSARSSAMFAVPEFTAWLMKNKELLTASMS